MPVIFTVADVKFINGTALPATKAANPETPASGTATTLTAKIGQVWSVTATENAWVEFGTAPTASTKTWPLVAGETRFFFVSTKNEKAAWTARS